MYNNSIPDEVIRKVLERNDIVEVVGKYVQLEKQGKNLKGLCPFHSEKTPSFTVSPEKQFFYCFGCGKGGSAIKFVMEMEGSSFPEAVRQLAEESGLPVTWSDSVPGAETNPEREKLLEAHELAAKFYHYLLNNTVHGKAAMQYLLNRGFTHKTIDTFQIGYAPAMKDALTQFFQKRDFSLSLLEEGGLLHKREQSGDYVDRFRERIMFPICDAKGRVIAFAGRVIQDAQPKYLNTPETILFNKRKHLYNLHQAKAEIRKSGKIVLFEGYVDVIKAWEAGVKNGVATMGTALTEQHAALIRRHAGEVVVCYDGDNAGQAAAEKNLPLLESAGCRVRVAQLPEKTDPDDYIRQHGAEKFVREVIENASSATAFRLQYAESRFPLRHDEGKLQYIRYALEIIGERPSPTEREHYLKELSLRFDYSLDALKQEMHEIRQKKEKKGTIRDRNAFPWNNVRNRRRPDETQHALMPAYHNAEKYLLASMFHDREITRYVEEQLGDEFHVEIHAALAAYLYAYYARNDHMDWSRFISMLQNEELENAASAIALEDRSPVLDRRVIDDYIAAIKIYPQLYSTLKQKREELKAADRAGDVMRAVEIGNEIITLEKKLKSLKLKDGSGDERL